MPYWLELTIKIASGPVIGAVIGFFTNWLAVRMLFRPYRPKYIGKLRLPFTPGIIPKRKEALGRALGKAVGTQLVTPSDIQKLFASDEICARVGDIAANALIATDDGLSVRGVADSLGGEGGASRLADRATDAVTAELMRAAGKLDLPALLAEHAGKAVASRGGLGGLLGLLGGDRVAAKLAESAGERLRDYLNEHGEETARPVVREEIDKLLDTPVKGALERAGLTKERVAELAAGAYRRYVVDKLADVIAGFDIAGTVAAKVREMDMKELEGLFMTVMKRELRAIVNLGGLLGALVGAVNSLIMIFL